MKKTLHELIDPGFSPYRSIGELARTLQHLLGTASLYRAAMKKNSRQLYGPHETLIGYRYCVNCDRIPWHSGRIYTYAELCGASTWQQNHDFLYRCILSSLCDRGAIFEQWRKEKGISLDATLKLPMASQNQKEEQLAWDALTALHGYSLPVPTLNSAHPRVNVLVEPELVISKESISIRIAVTQRSELRKNKTGYPRWDACFLTEAKIPHWHCQRETFAAFVLRVVEFYKTLIPGPRHTEKGKRQRRLPHEGSLLR